MTNHHRQQLFHWISAGRDSELRKQGRPIGGPLDPRTREEYVERLIGSLEKGLWMRKPSVQEKIVCAKGEIAPQIAMTCFTEWALGDSTAHTQRYGRLGFGFSKRWVIARGGQPVTYFRNGRNSVFARALWHLHHASTEEQAKSHGQVLMGFSKPIRPQSRSGKRKSAQHDTVKNKKRPRVNVYSRQWSNPMQFLEEREWRIIEPVLRSIRPAIPFNKGNGNSPEFYIPYETGKELFTVVLPDNETLVLALKRPEVQRAMVKPDCPHVTVLSLEDIGTM